MHADASESWRYGGRRSLRSQASAHRCPTPRISCEARLNKEEPILDTYLQDFRASSAASACWAALPLTSTPQLLQECIGFSRDHPLSLRAGGRICKSMAPKCLDDVGESHRRCTRFGRVR
jgi:hypothetical protein